MVGELDWKFLFTGLFLLLLHLVLWLVWLPSEPKGKAVSMESKRAREQINWFLNIWYNCFIVAWKNVVVRLPKYNVYRYIGCINDLSNWSGSFSLVVMMPCPIRNQICGFKSWSGNSTGWFYLQVCFSSYYSTHHPLSDDYGPACS